MKNLKTEKFIKLISEATEKLQKNSLDESYRIIKNALCENPDAPEPHNLLGLWYEKNKKFDLARKHYRAAYALDPTYKSATVNLERVCTMFSGRLIPLDFGESLVESDQNLKNKKETEAESNV